MVTFFTALELPAAGRGLRLSSEAAAELGGRDVLASAEWADTILVNKADLIGESCTSNLCELIKELHRGCALIRARAACHCLAC